MQYEKEQVLKIYTEMLHTRLMEKKLTEIYAQGIVPGHIHSGMGQEGSYIGVLSTRKPGDYFKFGHRPLSVYHIVGEPMDNFFGELLAKRTGNALGHGGTNHLGRLQDGVVGFSGTLGADAGIAVGAGLTISMEGRDNVSYYFYGDGTASRGPVHEAMCLASSWKLPVLFVCENNGFAISTPVTYSSAVKNPGGDRAAGYNMPSVVVDGTDILAVYEGASKMVDYIRAGNGPALIECKDYRWRGHFEGDQCAYRDPEVTQHEMETRDCVALLEERMKAQGWITDEELQKMREDFDREMDESIARAQEAEEIKPEEIYDCLFA
ncbi:MAG: thiamine pyrophosphate-dependent dehydrogenase E1 component subunit alpha [Oscillospiraceae bacterium]|jgi:pyruvate dehydrogenase E1 component alpha subunit|nr:thiamine pyrophosphate-dependent dehydrogenase E1 component subunit alpha [Oscillospiraceae bacterium]